MKLSIHHTRGKSANPDYTNLGYGWNNIEADWAEVFELITIDGHATSAELTSDNRKEANFVSRQLLMVDVDGGMTIPELLSNAFYTEYGAGFYATHSFKPEHHKFRICFVLEQAETDRSRLRKIIRGLLQVYPAGDKACSDPVRLFYGNPNCLLKHRTDKLLTTDIVEQLIVIIEEQDRVSAEAMTHYTGPAPELNDLQRQRILELLKQTYVGNYPLWRNVGWGLKAGGFALNDFQYVTTGMMSQKTPGDAATVWTHGGQVSKPVTMGSVIHLLRERHGRDCLKETRTSKQENELSFLIKDTMKMLKG
jgi:hypothetical protein